MDQGHLEGLLKHKLGAPPPNVLIQLDLGSDQGVFIFNKFPRDADVTGLGTTDLH